MQGLKRPLVISKGENMIKAKILSDAHYPARWVFKFKPMPAGSIVPVIKAGNIQGKDCYWINTPELEDDAYSILLMPGDYKIVD
jgi:hypothetical protein